MASGSMEENFFHHVKGAIGQHKNQGNDRSGKHHARLDYVGYHNAPLTGHRRINEDHNAAQNCTQYRAQAQVLKQRFSGNDLAGHNADGSTTVDDRVNGAGRMSSISLVQTLGQSQRVGAVQLFCNYNGKNDIAETGAQAEEHSAYAIGRAILGAAYHHAVSDVGAQVRTTDNQKASLFRRSHELLEIMGRIPAQIADEHHRSHINNQDYHYQC